MLTGSRRGARIGRPYCPPARREYARRRSRSGDEAVKARLPKVRPSASQPFAISSRRSLWPNARTRRFRPVELIGCASSSSASTPHLWPFARRQRPCSIAPAARAPLHPTAHWVADRHPVTSFASFGFALPPVFEHFESRTLREKSNAHRAWPADQTAITGADRGTAVLLPLAEHDFRSRAILAGDKRVCHRRPVCSRPPTQLPERSCAAPPYGCALNRRRHRLRRSSASVLLKCDDKRMGKLRFRGDSHAEFLHSPRLRVMSAAIEPSPGPPIRLFGPERAR